MFSDGVTILSGSGSDVGCVVDHHLSYIPVRLLREHCSLGCICVFLLWLCIFLIFQLLRMFFFVLGGLQWRSNCCCGFVAWNIIVPFLDRSDFKGSFVVLEGSH